LLRQAILSQFTRKTKDDKSDEELDENDPLDEEEQQAISELDLDRDASDAQEIEEMAGGIEQRLRLTEEDIALGRRALTKVTIISVADVLPEVPDTVIGHVTCFHPAKPHRSASIEVFSAFLDHKTGKTDLP
jgi:hypothetical protein